jgi:phosphopantothenoylcysteine decarboxylase / phosphopantothenate---cysteine ligase
MSVLDGKTIVLGVSGGIAAYKAASIASGLVQRGARVRVVLTASAQQFIQPLTFSAITHSPVHTNMFTPWNTEDSGHVSLSHQAHLLIVAPATASTIARIALGVADDFLGLVALSTLAPLLIAPAMEQNMYRHPATQGHLATLVERGAVVIGPEKGHLASGQCGEGRLAPPEDVIAAAERMLTTHGILSGKRVVITAGGTREPLDPVRYIGNRSSGNMGYALARAALDAGAEVTLVSGPVSISCPPGVALVPVETALDMKAAVETAVRDADIVIMAAAVSDFRPSKMEASKIKKGASNEPVELRLVRNPDIIAGITKPGLVKIGFAAETEDLIANADRKLRAKDLAMIVANDAEDTIGSAESSATIIMANGDRRVLPRMSKASVASEIIRAAADLSHRPASQWQ